MRKMTEKQIAEMIASWDSCIRETKNCIPDAIVWATNEIASNPKREEQIKKALRKWKRIK